MDDVAVLERLRAGDEDAFRELVTTLHPTLVRIARMYVADEAAAEDVAQETWIAVLRGIERFEQRSSLRTWLITICANRARSAGARAARQRPVDASGPSVPAERFNEGGMWVDPPTPFDELVDDAVDRQELESALHEALDALNDVQRAVVTLRDVEGLSTSEVAQALDMSEGNVRVTLHRARAALRARLEDLARARGGGQ